MIRVCLVDDHPVLRSGLRVLLSDCADLEVVAEAGNGAELLALLATTPADVVVLDVHMPGMDGAEAARRVRAEFPSVQVLGLSSTADLEQVRALLEAGFLGYVLKSALLAEVVFAIRQVAAGAPFLSTELSLRSLEAATSWGKESRVVTVERVPLQQALTRRELEVLQLVATGLSNEEIAGQLFTSKRTVETHRQNLIAKTQTKNTAGLVHYAARQGLV